MVSKVNVGKLAVAVLSAVVIGGALGLGAGFAAKSLGWSTDFVAPLTGGAVSALVALFYQIRVKRDGGGAG
jgi:hypothetical protein